MKSDKSNTQENNNFLEDLFNKIDSQRLYNKINNKNK